MGDLPPKELITGVSWGHLLTYFWNNQSLFRHYQNVLLARFGAEFTGYVVELGCEQHYQAARFFPRVDEYRCTNVARDYVHYLDVTAMHGVPDQSVDGFVCISVLEHLGDFEAALREIYRTLKPGGRLLLTVPFMFPRHDDADYWRFGEDFYAARFGGYRVVAFVQLGGRLATLADTLQKPRARWGKSMLVYKPIGLYFALLAKYFERLDDYASGYGLYAVKR